MKAFTYNNQGTRVKSMPLDKLKKESDKIWFGPDGLYLQFGDNLYWVSPIQLETYNINEEIREKTQSIVADGPRFLRSISHMSLMSELIAREYDMFEEIRQLRLDQAEARMLEEKKQAEFARVEAKEIADKKEIEFKKEVDKARETFRVGGFIEPRLFLILCRLESVEVHPRTSGTILRRVVGINKHTYRYVGKKYESPSLSEAIRELRNKTAENNSQD